MLPLGIRQNNPGNIRATPNSFRIYGSPEEGLAATMQNLIAYNDKHGINTINGALNRWAPASDGNNVGAYVNDVAQTAGMHPDQPYNVRDPQTLMTLAGAITKHENGSVPYTPDQFNTAAQMALNNGSISRSSQSVVMPPQANAAAVTTDPFAGVASDVQSSGSDPFAGVASDVNAPAPQSQQAIPYKDAFIGDSGPRLQQIAKGATFGLSDEIGAGLGAARMAMDRGTLNNLGEDYNVGLQGVRQEQAQYEQQNPLSSLGLQALGGLPAALISGSTIANGFRGSNLATRIGASSAAGAASGGAYGFGTGEGQQNRLQSAGQGALVGGALGAALPIAPAAGSGAKNLVAPAVDEAIAPLAQKALNDYKIPLSSSQLGKSGFAKTLASTVEEVPLSGALKFREKQQSAFNSAIAKSIGETSNKITPEVIDAAYTNIGAKFDEALAGRTIKISDEIMNKVSDIESRASESITGEHFKIVRNNISKFLNDIADDGTMSGEKINSLRSNLTASLKKTKNDASSYLADLRDAVVDASVDGFPGNRELLNKARLQYKNLKTIEPLAIKADRGDIAPSLLNSRVAAQFRDFSRGGGGELGDLARIGQAFLKDKIPNSGTPRRLAAYAALFGGGGAALGGGLPGAIGGLATAAKGIGLSAGYNALNTAQPLIRGAVNRAAKKSPMHVSIYNTPTGGPPELPKVDLPAMMRRQ